MTSDGRGGGGGGVGMRVGKYELGRTLGEGTFAKVKFARDAESGENFAIKILDKEKIFRHHMADQIKREISTMKLIRHPNVIQMYEVMASKTKIYIVLEFVTGGELFNKIASRGRLKEDEARKYFQQLINAVDYCHSRAVFHRDLKPENLLLDASGVLKVSDFGLSALPQQFHEDGLLHTTCGTPNYVAPEVVQDKGYDGAKADTWSCGVILFVIMAGYLPFEDSNIMSLYKKVMASKTKIYIVLEFVTGGELFNKIASRGRLKEDEARKYFQQLINAVDYCHSRAVFHRDLKPENLLLDASGVLKVSDFGLSALPQQFHEDGLLHTTCGTPNYVAPEVVQDKGYDGAKADTWSCGVILFVIMAGYLPFEDSNIMSLYKKIFKAEFICPPWFSTSAKKLIKKILDPNPQTRITISEIIENEWFKKGYEPPKFETLDVNLDDVHGIFDEEPRNLVVERREQKPALMNAFELISTSRGLNLSSLFEKEKGLIKRETRFTSKLPAKEILAKIEEAAIPLGFSVEKNNYKLKLKGEKIGRKGHLSIATEILEIAPSLYMVELRKSKGDTLEFHKASKSLSSGLKDIFWQPMEGINRADESKV